MSQPNKAQGATRPATPPSERPQRPPGEAGRRGAVAICDAIKHVEQAMGCIAAIPVITNPLLTEAQHNLRAAIKILGGAA